MMDNAVWVDSTKWDKWLYLLFDQKDHWCTITKANWSNSWRASWIAPLYPPCPIITIRSMSGNSSVESSLPIPLTARNSTSISIWSTRTAHLRSHLNSYQVEVKGMLIKQVLPSPAPWSLKIIIKNQASESPTTGTPFITQQKFNGKHAKHPNLNDKKPIKIVKLHQKGQ